MTTTTRDFAAEYFATCLDARRPGATLDDTSKARRKGARIANAADRAGVRIDEISLDEQARLELYPTPAPRERIVDYTSTGLPIYG